MSNTGSLSRLPLPKSPPKVPQPTETILLIATLSTSLSDAAQIRETERDPLLSRVHRMVTNAWTERVGTELQPYYAQKEFLNVQEGCLLLGSLVIIPPVSSPVVLMLLRKARPGLAFMKRFECTHVWWPGMDQESETVVQWCGVCQSSLHAPPKVNLHQ